MAILHVLDLPAIYTKPSATDLLASLNLLKVQPFDYSKPKSGSANDTTRIEIHGNLPEWLTGIIKSKLAWVSDDEREELWDLASVRLAERAGQMGQTSTERTFEFAWTCDDTHSGEASIVLYEPAIVQDNLGTKTWGSAYLMAKHLPELARHVPGLVFRHNSSPGVFSSGGPRILELGAGTGLVGIAAYHLFASTVMVTDLPGPVLDNLRKNIESNLIDEDIDSVEKARISPQALDWNDAPGPLALPEAERYQVIVAADPVYDARHPPALAKAVDAYLSRDAAARFVIELPRRDGFAGIRAALYAELAGVAGLTVLAQGVHLGHDEWGADRDESQREHEWAVLRRQP